MGPLGELELRVMEAVWGHPPATVRVADAAVLRARVLDAWRRGASARAALAAIDVALAEEWPTLAP